MEGRRRRRRRRSREVHNDKMAFWSWFHIVL